MSEKRWPPRLTEGEAAAVMGAFNSGVYKDGEHTRAVEALMQSITGAPYCVAFNNCTAAIQAALVAHGAGPDTIVQCPAFTYAGTWTGAAHIGCIPAWRDSRVDDLTLTPFTPPGGVKVSALTIAVDLHGAPHRLPRHGGVITDACQSLGTKVNGRHIGVEGTHCWSFGSAKTVAAPAGAAITTDDEEIVFLLRALRDHGTVADGPRARRLLFSSRGHSWMPSEVDMALVAQRLTRLDWIADRMYSIGEELRQCARHFGYRVQRPMLGSKVAWHKVRVAPGELMVHKDLEWALQQAGVDSHRWGRPLHRMIPYASPIPVDLPIADWTADTSLCLGTEAVPHWTWTTAEVSACKDALQRVAMRPKVTA